MCPRVSGKTAPLLKSCAIREVLPGEKLEGNQLLLQEAEF